LDQQSTSFADFARGLMVCRDERRALVDATPSVRITRAKVAAHQAATLRARSADELCVHEKRNPYPGPNGRSPAVSTGLGAIILVIPFMFTTGTNASVAAASVALVTDYLVGATGSSATLRRGWSAGLKGTLAGLIVGGATYLVGLGFAT